MVGKTISHARVVERIDADDRVRILDFGLAKLKGVSGITSGSSTHDARRCS